MRFLRSIAVLVPAALLFAGCLAQTPNVEPPKPAAWLEPELPKVDAAKLLANLTTFVKAYPIRQGNSDGHKGAREALAKEFGGSGLTVWRHEFTQSSLPQENICGYRLGAIDNQTWVIVGAHYDTTTWAGQAKDQSEGAYDDGSGTQIIVEAAKAVANVSTRYSVLFCAFDGEERGLRGSEALALALKEDQLPFPYKKTRAMLDIDMFGICWPVRAPIIAHTKSQVLATLMDQKRKEMGVPDDMWKTDLLVSPGGSDYATFEKRNVPTLFFMSDMGDMAAPMSQPNEKVPSVPVLTYPWWHWMDTVENMERMAGSPDLLRAGFQTATDLTIHAIGVMAVDDQKKL